MNKHTFLAADIKTRNSCDRERERKKKNFSSPTLFTIIFPNVYSFLFWQCGDHTKEPGQPTKVPQGKTARGKQPQILPFSPPESLLAFQCDLNGGKENLFPHPVEENRAQEGGEGGKGSKIRASSFLAE